MIDPGCTHGRRPFAVTELLEVDVTAARSGEEERRVDPRRHLVERVEHALTEWDRSRRPVGLAALLQVALREATTNVDHSRVAVDVGSLERDPFLGPQPGADRK